MTTHSLVSFANHNNTSYEVGNQNGETQIWKIKTIRSKHSVNEFGMLLYPWEFVFLWKRKGVEFHTTTTRSPS
jgi:hypothetical protein